MPVNKEELAKDLETPEYQQIVKEALTKKEMVIRTKTEETEFLDRHKKDVIEKEIPAEIEKVHNQYDKDFGEVFGEEYKRNQNEKTYDAFKRVGKARLEKLSGEITTLKEQIKGGDPSGALKKQLDEAEQKYRAQLDLKDKEIQTLSANAANIQRRAAVDTVYAGIKSTFKKELPPLFSLTEKAVIDDVLANSKVQDVQGKSILFMTNPDGSFRKDAQFREITVEEHLKTTFKDVLDEKKAQGGAGSGNNDKNKDIDPTKITKDNFEMPAGIKTKDDLMTHMLSIGLKRGTKEFTDIWNQFSKDIKQLA